MDNIRYYYESFMSQDLSHREFKEKINFVIKNQILNIDNNDNSS